MGRSCRTKMRHEIKLFSFLYNYNSVSNSPCSCASESNGNPAHCNIYRFQNDMIGVFCRGGNRFRCNIDRTRNPEPFLIQDEEYGWMTDKARMLP
jgi:hypothetical protein